MIGRNNCRKGIGVEYGGVFIDLKDIYRELYIYIYIYVHIYIKKTFKGRDLIR